MLSNGQTTTTVTLAAHARRGLTRSRAFAASEDPKSPKGSKWLVDSGASSHMTWDRSVLTEFKTPEKVGLVDGRIYSRCNRFWECASKHGVQSQRAQEMHYV